MKAIYMGLVLGALATLTLGCSVTPEESARDSRECRHESVVQTETDQIDSSPRMVRCGFAIRDFRAIRDEYARVHVIGEVENVGSATRGVELQVALRNTDGRLISVGHFCPAAGNNIAPGEVWPFSYSFGRQAQGVRAELRIVDTFRSMAGPDAVTRAR